MTEDRMQVVGDHIPGLEQVINGDENGWDELYKAIRDMLRGTIRARRPPFAYIDDDDILHDVFVKLLSNERAALRSLKGRSVSDRRGFVKNTAKYRCADKWRKHWREKEGRFEGDPETAIQSYQESDKGLIEKVLFEIRRLIWRVLSCELSPAQIQAVQMRFAGYKGKDIAEELGIPENTVHSHVRRGIASLNRLASRRFPEIYGDVSLTDVIIHAS